MAGADGAEWLLQQGADALLGQAGIQKSWKIHRDERTEANGPLGVQGTH